jgi:hypothetical protein
MWCGVKRIHDPDMEQKYGVLGLSCVDISKHLLGF